MKKFVKENWFKVTIAMEGKIEKIKKDILNLIILFLFILKFFIVVLLLFYILSYIFKNLNKELSDQILEYLKVIVWPFVIIFLGMRFDSEIKKLIERVKGFEYSGARIDTSPEQNIPNLTKSPQTNKKKESEEKQNETKNIEKDSLIDNLSESLGYEKIYNIIYGSQIELLENLRSNSNGIIYQDIAAFYYEKIKIIPALSSYSLGKYLTYLETVGLVKKVPAGIDKYSYIITTKGIDFLNYIETNNYLKRKAF